MKIIAGVLLLLFGIFMAAVVIDPQFGVWENRDVTAYYLEQGAFETGSSNIVNAIVWDFRGYDTMGEETVLFTAAIGIVLIMGVGLHGHNHKKH